MDLIIPIKCKLVKLILLILLVLILSVCCQGSRPDADRHLNVSVAINTEKLDYLKGENININYTIKNMGGRKGDWDSFNKHFIYIKIPQNFSVPRDIHVYRNEIPSIYYYIDETKNSIKIPLNYSKDLEYITDINYELNYLKGHSGFGKINLADYVKRPDGLALDDFIINDKFINILNRPPSVNSFSVNPKSSSIYANENLTFWCSGEDLDGYITRWVIFDRCGNHNSTLYPESIDNTNTISKLTYSGRNHEVGLHRITTVVYDSDFAPSIESNAIEIEILNESSIQFFEPKNLSVLIALYLFTLLISRLLNTHICSMILKRWYYMLLLVIPSLIFYKYGFIVHIISYSLSLIISILYLVNKKYYNDETKKTLLLLMPIASMMVLYQSINQNIIMQIIISLLAVIAGIYINPQKEKIKNLVPFSLILALIVIYYYFGCNLYLIPLSNSNSISQALSIFVRELLLLIIPIVLSGFRSDSKNAPPPEIHIE